MDQWLVQSGRAPSRQKAKEWIERGLVSVASRANAPVVIEKPSFEVDPANPPEIKIQRDEQDRFVSRGGLKLEGAFKTIEGLLGTVDLAQASVLDIGLSTGGFADCCLQRGARRVIGVDVGHGQLAVSLQNEPRLKSFEGVNARTLSTEPLASQIRSANQNQNFDWIVVDVSFISLKLILPAATDLLLPKGQVLALVKPQFEVGRGKVGKGGIVTDESLYPLIETEMKQLSASLGLKVESYFESSIVGADGNREFFLYGKMAKSS